MAKHIGIISVSSEGTALCFRTICEESWAILGKFVQPEISIHNHSLKDYMDCISEQDWKGVASLLLSSANKLAAAGAEFAICPDNTVHFAFEKLEKKSPIPLLSIVDVVVKECKSKGYTKVGVLGTKYTMQGGLYKNALSKVGIEMIIPNEKDQINVNEIIFDELGPGQVTESSSKPLIEVIQKLKEMGCDAVILGCTELPLVINSKNSPLPPIDSTRLLARKALEYSLEKSLYDE